MSIEVLTPAVPNGVNALVTAATVAAAMPELSIPSGAVDLYIRWASEEIANHLEYRAEEGLALAVQQYRFKLAGYGDCKLELGIGPIVGAPVVRIDGVAVEDFEVAERADGVLYREEGWDWRPRYGGRLERRPVAGTERLNIEVDSWAGWRLPEQETEDLPAGAPALPGPIERAALVAVKEWYLEDQRDALVVGRNIPQGDAGSATITFAMPTGIRRNLPPSALPWLRRYKREVL